MINVQHYLFFRLPSYIRGDILIDNESGCWNWTSHLNRTGYGRVYLFKGTGGRPTAHRYVYQLLRPSVSLSGLVLDHVQCSNRKCCNPTHMSPVTQKVNVHRGKGRKNLFKKV